MANQNISQITNIQTTTDPTTKLYGVPSNLLDSVIAISTLFNNTVLTGTPTVPGYLTSALAASTYVTQTTLINNYSTTAQATATYAPITGSTVYATIAQATTALAATGGTLNNVVIGATTAAAARVTTLAATNLITPSSTIGIKGTTAADSAQAGSVGEYLTNNTIGTPITSGTSLNLTSLSLTAGDWDVDGAASFTNPGTTVIGNAQAGATITSATAPVALGTRTVVFVNGTGGPCFPIPTQRFNLTATTTIFLVGTVNFSVSTLTGDGLLRARRVR